VSHATPALSVPLKAAQDALSAKRYADAIAKLKEAEANPHGLSQISTLRLEMRMAEPDDNLHRKIVFGGARVIAWFLSIVSRIQRKGARENWGNSRFTNASRCETPSNRSRAARLGCRKADGDQGRLGVATSSWAMARTASGSTRLTTGNSLSRNAFRFAVIHNASYRCLVASHFLVLWLESAAMSSSH
jgi:hypothetical protein